MNNVERGKMKKFKLQTFKVSKIAACLTCILTSQTPLLAAAENKKDQLEIIEVKAQKRTQNLQKVPISVTALSGDKLAESIIKDVFDLQTSVPGLQVTQNNNATATTFSIRGVGTDSSNFGLESSVGLYIDGVYRARQSAMVNNLVDIESVEVLRGPQGTLFGKNTPSGAVLMNTIAPIHGETNAFFEATLGNYNLMNLSAASSFSVVDDLLTFRLTGFSSQRDGYVDDVNLGDNVLNDRNRYGGRLQALYTPSNDISIRIIADYAEIDEVCCASPTFVSNKASQQVPGLMGSDTLMTGMLGATSFTGEDFHNNTVALSLLPRSASKDKGISAEINWQLDEEISLTSVTASRTFDSYDINDADFGEAELLFYTNDAAQNSFSQELRLNYQSEKLNFIVGAYYFEQDLNLDYRLGVSDQFEPYLQQGIYSGSFNELTEGLNMVSAMTGGMVPGAAQAAPSGTNFDHFADQEHTSYALFGQFDYKLTDKLTVTAGLRATKEEKSLHTVYQENMPNDTEFPTQFNNIGELQAGAMAAGMALGNIAGGDMSSQNLMALVPFQTPGWGLNSLTAITSSRSDINTELDDEQPTYSLKLAYQADAFTMYYVSHGTGYKSGGTNTDRIAEGVEPVFDAETSKSFEFGLKKDLPEEGIRINAAVHYTTIEDFQTSVFTGLGFNLQNAGNMNTYGGELEMTWFATDDLEFQVSYAYLNAEYETFKGASCWTAYTFHTGQDDPGRVNPTDQFCDRSGDRVPETPENSLMVQAKQYFEVTDSIIAHFVVEGTYNSDMEGPKNDPLTKIDSTYQINLRLLLTLEEYDMDIVFWGRNVTDEKSYGKAFDAPLQPGKLMAVSVEPATYGITMKKRF